MSYRSLLAVVGLSVLAHVAAHAQALDCLVEPAMTLKIGSPISTTLASVEVKRGDTVHVGQVLARLDAGVEQADLALAEARARSTAEIDSRRSRLEFATADLSRGAQLLQGSNIAQQKVDELRTNFRVAQQDLVTAELNHQLAILDLARAQALLNQRLIRSPVDAVITQRLLGPGEFVHQDNQIVVLAVVSPLHVQVYPPIRLRSLVHRGQTTKVTLSVPAGESHEATVTVVDQVFDAASGTFGVQLDLPNGEGAISGGQRCQILFDSGAETKR